MKIAAEHKKLGARVMVLGLLFGPAIAQGAESPSASANPPPAFTASSTMAASAAEIPGRPDALPMPPLPGDKDDAKNSVHETKVPDSVREVVKHLTSSTEDITLDDLNAAREAVAKLDALIDIEKRLADLEKLRQERDRSPLIAAIPSSALSVSNRPPMSESSMPPMMLGSNFSVERVEGGGGHYTAFVKEPNGNTQAVRVGDHLADGSTVIAIMAEGIELEKGKATHLVMIKNIQTVFGGTP
jgi:type IV pilus biogenesis protein PilP